MQIISHHQKESMSETIVLIKNDSSLHDNKLKVVKRIICGRPILYNQYDSLNLTKSKKVKESQ